MTNEELQKFNEKRKIFQLCFITDDLERTLKSWVEDLKVGPWKIITFDNNNGWENYHVYGKEVTEPFKVLIACSWFGDIEIEIIQPVSGPLIFQEYLDRHGPGFHHFKEQVKDEDFEKTLEEYKNRGIPVSQGGKYYHDLHAFLDSESKSDFILEIGNGSKDINPNMQYKIYP